MITKTTKKSICSILAAMVLTMSVPMPAQALAAGATYTAYEIISIIAAVVGGTTISQTQGLVGGSSFNANALYESMNAQQAGIGTLLSSYVDRSQYMAPGSELVISEADYQEFLKYFREHNMQSTISGQIDSESVQDFKSKLEAFTGKSVGGIPQSVIDKINSGEYTHIVKFKEFSGSNTGAASEDAFVICGDYEVVFSVQLSNATLYQLQCQNNYCFYKNYWAENQPAGNFVTIWNETYSGVNILGGTGFKSDTIANGKIKNGTYDTLSKSREWNEAQGKIVGPCTITMPATSTLSDVLEAENVKGITDAVNVYPVDTADDTMIYYPTQSAEDFKVPEMTVQTNVNVQFPAIEGEAASYTMDLTTFFPFCIPFDIYAFLQAFEENPEAPSITYRFPYLDNNGNVAYIEQTYNLSQFDGVAQLVRRLELVAFIVGLAFVTRSFFLRG